LRKVIAGVWPLAIVTIAANQSTDKDLDGCVPSDRAQGGTADDNRQYQAGWPCLEIWCANEESGKEANRQASDQTATHVTLNLVRWHQSALTPG
jgi:hypothetical protein